MAGRPEEYFWRDDASMWRERWGVTTGADYIAAALNEGSTENGVFGARVMWAYLDDLVELASAATGTVGRPVKVLASTFPGLRYVHLWRRDRVAQAVSWARAEQTGRWYARDSGTTGKEASYDRHLIDRLIAAIDEGERGWSSFFAETNDLRYHVSYEELADEPERTALRVLEFLGVHPHGPLVASTGRQADAMNAEWIAHYTGDAFA